MKHSANVSLFKYFLVLTLAEIVFSDNVTVDDRGGRIFPFIIFPFRPPTVTPASCTVEGQDGICYSNARCAALGLTVLRSCSTGGVCCVAIKTCGESSSSPIIYFRKTSTTSNPPRCTFKINKANSTITQLRLDFIRFSLRQPVNGLCTNYLLLSSTDPSLPKICGTNDGSHVYIDFDPNCNDHTLEFNFDMNDSNDDWLIKITQISYTSDLEAPRGCLMYYRDSVSGTVTSFNFGIVTAGNRQLSPLNYGVCIRPQTRSCQLRWTSSQFIISPDGAPCDHNYVVIPGSSSTTNQDRYCGITFPTEVTTTSKPFVLTVVTNLNPTEDMNTAGFQLNFQQVGC